MVKLSAEKFESDETIIRFKNKLTLGKKIMKFVVEYYKRPFFGKGATLRDYSDYLDTPDVVSKLGTWSYHLKTNIELFYEPRDVSYYYIGSTILTMSQLAIDKHEFELFGFGVFTSMNNYIDRIIQLGKKCFDETFKIFGHRFIKYIKTKNPKISTTPSKPDMTLIVKSMPELLGKGLNYSDYIKYYERGDPSTKNTTNFIRSVNTRPDVYLTRDEKIQLILANFMTGYVMIRYTAIIKRKPKLPV